MEIGAPHVTISDWVLIGTTILLAVTAFLTPYVGEKIRHWWAGPELRIQYQASPPGSHKTRLDVRLSAEQVAKHETYYFRLAVSNVGGSQAKRCEVVLEGLYKMNVRGGLEPLKHFGPIGMLWGSGYEDFVDINPSRTFFCDFLTVPDEAAQRQLGTLGAYVDFPGEQTDSAGLVLCTRAAFYSQPNRLPPGTYRLKLAVFAENAAPVRTSIEVVWSGRWDRDESRMFEQCNIRQFATSA